MTRFITRKELTNKKLSQVSTTERILLEGEQKIPENGGLLEQQVPEGEIWLYHPSICGEGEELSLIQLLLDERYAEGYINLPMQAMEQCGYLNERLPEKRVYELLLRIAEHYAVIGKPLKGNRETADDKTSNIRESYKADCYIVGKYSQLLQQSGYFEEVVEVLLQEAQQSGDTEKALVYLEDMVGKKEIFRRIEAGTAPILIYYGVTYCYNVMNVMLGQLAESLKKKGIPVICYDEQKEDAAGLSRYVGQRFRAIVGMQTYLLSVYMKETGRFLHDEIEGPKFNIVLDHPLWLNMQLRHTPRDYYVLVHDENYRNFIKKYYSGVKGTYLFPPAGIRQQEEVYYGNRKYGISFIGTYGDYRNKCEVIHRCGRSVRFLANRFLLYMRRETELTAEAAFQKALDYYGIELPDEQFLEWLYQMGEVIQCVMYYYREKVVKTLINAGIHVDIWGESWQKSKLSHHRNLTIHRDADSQESLAVLRDSKVSLNVMAWHKGGFTERMANSMLAGAVVLTDITSYSGEGFCPGKHCVMFSLNQLEQLPGIAERLLQEENWRKQIAKQGFEYAGAYHTWEKRAEKLLALIEELA